MGPLSKFKDGCCVEWEVARVYTGGSFEVWASVASERAGHAHVRKLAKEDPLAKYALVRVTQEIVAPPRPKHRKRTTEKK